MDKSAVVGRIGRADILPMPRPHELPRPETAAQLANYLVTMPTSQRPWHQYVAFIVHLRHVPGETKPPWKSSERMTHQFFLVALDPNVGVLTAANANTKIMRYSERRSPFLYPTNIALQLSFPSDDLAQQFCAWAVRAIVDGAVPYEPEEVGKPFQGEERERWTTFVAAITGVLLTPDVPDAERVALGLWCVQVFLCKDPDPACRHLDTRWNLNAFRMQTGPRAGCWATTGICPSCGCGIEVYSDTPGERMTWEDLATRTLSTFYANIPEETRRLMREKFPEG